MGNDGAYVFDLIASQGIPPFTEILVNYGAAYIFPSHTEGTTAVGTIFLIIIITIIIVIIIIIIIIIIIGWY